MSNYRGGVTFSMIKPHPAPFGVSTYYDKDGNLKGIQTGTGKQGEPIYKRFKWPANYRNLK